MAKPKVDRRKYRINPFRMALASVELDFRELALLADFIESIIRQELASIEKWVADEVKKKTPEQLEESYENASGSCQVINQYFRHRLRYSLLVTIYSVIESRLNDACGICKNAVNRAVSAKYSKDKKDNASFELFPHQKEISLDYTDIKGRGIERASLYLQKVLKLSFPQKGRGPWQNIKILANIRHCIVHTDGFDDEKKVALFIKKHPDYAKYSDKGQLEIEAKYCMWIVEQAKNFFAEFYSSNMDVFNTQRETIYEDTR